jgi:hypothetical protein
MRRACKYAARRGRSCRAALADFAAAVSHEAAALWEALGWVAADLSNPRPRPAAAAEQAISTMNAAADRANALADGLGIPPAGSISGVAERPST